MIFTATSEVDFFVVLRIIIPDYYITIKSSNFWIIINNISIIFIYN